MFHQQLQQDPIQNNPNLRISRCPPRATHQHKALIEQLCQQKIERPLNQQIIHLNYITLVSIFEMTEL